MNDEIIILSCEQAERDHLTVSYLDRENNPGHVLITAHNLDDLAATIDLGPDKVMLLAYALILSQRGDH